VSSQPTSYLCYHLGLPATQQVVGTGKPGPRGKKKIINKPNKVEKIK
jgi:hypothetical protein